MKNKWLNLPRKINSVTSDFGGGINVGAPGFSLKDNEAVAVRNIDSRKLPALAARAARTPLGISYPIESLGEVYYMTVLPNGNLAIVYYNSKSYRFGLLDMETKQLLIQADSLPPQWSTIFYDMNVGERVMVFVMPPNNLYYIRAGGNAVFSISNAPAATFVASLDDYLFAASGQNNFLNVASKGRCTVWSGEGTQRIALQSGRLENCTGLVSYNDRIVYFTRHSMFEVFSAKNEIFSATNVSNNIGCTSGYSLCEVGGALFWLGTEGVYMYKGGSKPRVISGKIQAILNDFDFDRLRRMPAAGTDGTRYYLSIIGREGSESILFVYDTVNDVWHVEDNPGFVSFVRRDGKLFAVTMTGEIYDMIDFAGEERIEWEWVSKPFTGQDYSSKQNWYKMFVLVEMQGEATLGCDLIAASGKTITLPNIQNVVGVQSKVHPIEIPLDGVYHEDYVQIRFWGNGRCVVHGIERQMRLTE